MEEKKTRKQEIEERKAEIAEEVKSTDNLETIEKLSEEVDALKEEETLIENQEKDEIPEEKKFEVKEVVKEERKMENNKELRNSEKYINAYAEYMKSTMVPGYEMDSESRALVTTGGYATGNSAVVEVPDLVEDRVRTAWEREELAKLVKRIAVKGNYKVQFEVSGSDATIHTEGNGAVNEEELVLGIVTLTPKSIKKWISVSDEVLDLRGEAFLNYIYDEIVYKIAKKCVDTLIAKIAALPQSLVANDDGIYDTVSAAKITEAPGLATITNAVSKLSDEANNVTIVMNKETYATFKAAQLAANYAQDIFEGHRVAFNNTLPAYSSANANSVYAIVGDFENGALFNFPNGEGVEIKYDDKTKMEYDLVRILGREYVGIEAVADKSFTLIAKPGISG